MDIPRCTLREQQQLTALIKNLFPKQYEAFMETDTPFYDEVEEQKEKKEQQSSYSGPDYVDVKTEYGVTRVVLLG